MIKVYVPLLLLFTQVDDPAIKKPKVTPKETAKFELPDRVPRIRLTLHAVPAPVPALKYRLLPELRDLKRGNAATRYYRAFAPEWQYWRKNDYAKAIDAWSADMRKLPPKQLAFVLDHGGLAELDLGARRTYVDWELLDPLREQGLALLVPDMQGFREQSRLLAARIRFETADHKFSAAIRSLQTGLKFSRDVASGPILVQALVGTAIGHVMFEQAEELMQTPGAPNLYWALTDLPRPFIDFEMAYQGERMFIDHLFPGVREVLAGAKDKSLTEALKKLPTDLPKTIRLLEGSSDANPLATGIGLAMHAARAYPQAREFLLAEGWSKKQVDALSVLHASLIYEVHNYDVHYDEFHKWTSLPYAEARQHIRKSEGRLREVKAKGSVGALLASLLVPAFAKVQEASARTDRRIAALRIIEALRLHASAKKHLPRALAEIDSVPIPLDPMTGQPFRYHFDNGKATLYAPPPQGESPHGGNTLIYELTLPGG